MFIYLPRKTIRVCLLRESFGVPMSKNVLQGQRLGTQCSVQVKCVRVVSIQGWLASACGSRSAEGKSSQTGLETSFMGTADIVGWYDEWTASVRNIADLRSALEWHPGALMKLYYKQAHLAFPKELRKHRLDPRCVHSASDHIAQ